MSASTPPPPATSHNGEDVLSQAFAALQAAAGAHKGNVVPLDQKYAEALLQEFAELQRIKDLLIVLKTCDEHDMDRHYFELLALVPEVA